jgi:hypothetical protein
MVFVKYEESKKCLKLKQSFFEQKSQNILFFVILVYSDVFIIL